MNDQPPEPAAPRELPLWIEILGWYGTAAIVGAYLGLSHGWLAEGTTYQLLNVSGACGVGLVCWKRRAWQPLTLEVVWALVGISALVF